VVQNQANRRGTRRKSATGEAMRPVAYVLLWFSLATVTLAGQDAKKTEAQGSTASKTTENVRTADAIAANDTSYKIGPQDTLRIDVWKEPEVSRAGLPVRPDGKISLPLLND